VVEKQLTYDEIGVSFALLLWKSVIETCSLSDDRLIKISRPLSSEWRTGVGMKIHSGD
jgi:hypothetical protein